MYILQWDWQLPHGTQRLRDVKESCV